MPKIANLIGLPCDDHLSYFALKAGAHGQVQPEDIVVGRGQNVRHAEFAQWKEWLASQYPEMSAKIRGNTPTVAAALLIKAGVPLCDWLRDNPKNLPPDMRVEGGKAAFQKKVYSYCRRNKIVC